LGKEGAGKTEDLLKAGPDFSREKLLITASVQRGGTRAVTEAFDRLFNIATVLK